MTDPIREAWEAGFRCALAHVRTGDVIGTSPASRELLRELDEALTARRQRLREALTRYAQHPCAFITPCSELTGDQPLCNSCFARAALAKR